MVCCFNEGFYDNASGMQSRPLIDNDVGYLNRGVRYISNVVILRDLSCSLYIANCVSLHQLFTACLYHYITICLAVYLSLSQSRLVNIFFYSNLSRALAQVASRLFAAKPQETVIPGPSPTGLLRRTACAAAYGSIQCRFESLQCRFVR